MSPKITKTYDEKNINFLNWIQYFIGVMIAILFAIGLIPFKFMDVYFYITGLIILQIFISIARLRFLNMFIEIVLLIIGALSLIPFLGYVFRIIGILVSILDISTFKSMVIYKRMKVVSVKSTKDKFKKKKPNNVQDADFEEK